jgi:hypothetical protein
VHPRKNRPVLFEVVARTQRARPRPAPPAAPTAAQTGPSASIPAAPSPPTQPAAAAPSDWRRFFRLNLASGEIRLALSRPQAALAGAGLVVLLMAVFFVGRYSASALPPKTVAIEDILPAGPVPEPPPTATAAPIPGRGRSSASPIVTPLPLSAQETPVAKPPPHETAPPPAPEPESPGAPALAHDSFYVVVQYFRLRDRSLADAAREFLRSNGIECMIRTGTDLQLVATEPFASEQQAEGLRKRIVEIGKEYRKSGGGYDFASAKARKF